MLPPAEDLAANLDAALKRAEIAEGRVMVAEAERDEARAALAEAEAHVRRFEEQKAAVIERVAALERERDEARAHVKSYGAGSLSAHEALTAAHATMRRVGERVKQIGWSIAAHAQSYHREPVSRDVQALADSLRALAAELGV